MTSVNNPRIILVKEAPSQDSADIADDETNDDSSNEETHEKTASVPNAARQKSVRFLDVEDNHTMHRGSIHEELCRMDQMKCQGTGKTRSRTISLADRPPPVFSITSIRNTEPQPLFSAAMNPQAAADSKREIDERIDHLLEESRASEDVLWPKGSKERLQERRMTVFQHQLLEFRNIEAAKTELKLRLQKLSTFLCAASILAVILGITDLEYSYSHGVNANTSNSTAFFYPVSNEAGALAICLKAGISLLSVLTCVLLYLYFHQHCRFLIIKHHLPLGATVFTCPERWRFLAEIVLCIFHVPPLTEVFLPNELQLTSFLRLYLVFRYMREHNHMAFSKSTRFLASVLQTELGAGFLVKTFFLKWPFRMVGICYCLNLFGVGYLVFSIDRRFSPSHYNPLLDVIWMQVVTMTTLGFGDVVPDSVMARAFVGMSSVFGIFLMALLITVTHETLQMSQQEKRILAYVERQDFADQVKQRAARCIQATWRLYWFKRSGHDSSPRRRMRRFLHPIMMRSARTRKRLVNELYEVLTQWREIRKRKTQDDGWAKDFVADNTAIMLTDVARRLEIMHELLKRSLGIEDDDLQQGEESVSEAPPHDGSTWPGHHDGGKRVDDDAVSMETVMQHLNDLGGSLEESHHRTMTEFQALRSLITTRKEGNADK
ncbi:small conductance calcium-activated potassium channel protein-like isoform X2 [Acanthaster planci]|uniref:Small conductance calcium-activated potassium channel protein-like isoform X2 n=1 Tax=Acanthaster planci TaxID=133434 RepID=A0A8B7Z6A4_ACAPL|nr:small conductance calcium-activated potassium channel protein-like isoform X2 [Acanthaster planci]